MINIESYKEYLFETAKEILACDSPSGYYMEIMKIIERYAIEGGAEFSLNNQGMATINVKGRSGEKTVALLAHTDTLGMIVRSISAEGLNFTCVGGPILPTLDGEYCTVITREGKRYTGTILSKSPAVHVYNDAKSRERNDQNMYVRLDEVAKTVDDIKNLGISNGDYICIDTKTVVTPSGFIKSRFLDDKISVACLITVLKILRDNNLKPQYDTKIMITSYEEVGHGAAVFPKDICEALAVDMGCVGSDLECTEYDVSICAKDSTGPYDYELTTRLINLAKKHELKYAVDIYPMYGSDVSVMLSAGADVKGALIGSGVHASHGMERTHFEGLKNTIALVLAYLDVL
jgi:putative aminopeptidase FrvX